MADSCGSIAFRRYFYRRIDTGSKSKGLVHRTLEYGETIEKNFRHGYLPGRIIHHYGRFGNDCRYCHGTRHCTGSLYPLFAPVIGCLGTFITGSDTSSNILFGKLQASVAGQIHVSPDWLSAANTVGATGGKIISPQSIAIATSAGNQQGKEGEILKAAIPYALTYVLITGIIVYIFS